jgi:hypothetical protein
MSLPSSFPQLATDKNPRNCKNSLPYTHVETGNVGYMLCLRKSLYLGSFPVGHSGSECLRLYLLVSFMSSNFFLQDFVCMSQVMGEKMKKNWKYADFTKTCSLLLMDINQL